MDQDNHARDESASRLTLGYLTLATDPISTVVAAGKAGFRGVSLRITGRRLSDPYVDVVGRRDMIHDIRQKLDDFGLGLSNISAYHFYPDVELDHLDRVLDTAAALGTRTVIANSFLSDQSRFEDLFGAYCGMAETRGIRIALEFMPYSEVRSLAAAAGIVGRLGHGNAGLVIDPLHLDRAGEGIADVVKVDSARLFVVQLCDAKPHPGATRDELRDEARTARLYPGEGTLPLHGLLDAIPPDLEIEVETPHPSFRHLDPAEQALRALAAARKFLDERTSGQAPSRGPASATTDR